MALSSLKPLFQAPKPSTAVSGAINWMEAHFVSVKKRVTGLTGPRYVREAPLMIRALQVLQVLQVLRRALRHHIKQAEIFKWTKIVNVHAIAMNY